jgi:flagellar basal body-associated protein FliL
MNDKLRKHVDILWVAAPKTQRAAEIKEELLTSLNDKYNDLLANGYDSTAAFQNALAGIGDIDELFKECGGEPVRPQPVSAQSELRRSNRTNRLLQVMLILVIVLLSFVIFSFVSATISGIAKHGNRNGWTFFGDNRIVPTGPVITQEREIGGDLSLVNISAVIPVEFRLSDQNKVVVETHEDMMSSILTDVKNDSLTIYWGSHRWYRNVKKLHVTVYCQSVPKTFIVSGASRLTCDETIKTESLSLNGEGASKIDFKNLESEKLRIQLTGASTMSIAGKTESAFVQVEGASKLRAENLTVDICDVRVSGASKAEVGEVGKELSVRVNGVSRFDYRGKPTIKKQEVTGASKVNAR